MHLVLKQSQYDRLFCNDVGFICGSPGTTQLTTALMQITVTLNHNSKALSVHEIPYNAEKASNFLSNQVKKDIKLLYACYTKGHVCWMNVGLTSVTLGM